MPATLSKPVLYMFKNRVIQKGTGIVYESDEINLRNHDWFKKALLVCKGVAPTILVTPTETVKYEKSPSGGFKYDWKNPNEMFHWFHHLFLCGALPAVEWKYFLLKHLRIDVPEAITYPSEIHDWLKKDGNGKTWTKYQRGVWGLFTEMMQTRDDYAVSEEDKATHRVECLGTYDLEVPNAAAYYGD
tara:strand:+ start:908 stop:1468 length:561 start_codon:yes stop_codon:yes gene_type:complete